MVQTISVLALILGLVAFCAILDHVRGRRCDECRCVASICGMIAALLVAGAGADAFVLATLWKW